MAFPPTFDHPWDITQPPDTQLANLLGQDIRNLKDDIMQRIAILAGNIADRPTPETVNATWGGTTYGLLFFSLDENKVYRWNGAAWLDVTAQIGGGGGGGISLQTNGVANAIQNVLNLVAGAGVTLTAGGAGDVTIAASGGGGAPITGFDLKNLAGPVGVPATTLVQVDSVTVTFPSSGGPWRVLGSYHYWINGGVQWQTGMFDGTNWFAQAMKVAQNNNSCTHGTELSPVTYANSAVVTFSTYIFGDGNGTVVTIAPNMGSAGRVTSMGNSHMSLAVMASA